MPISMVVPDVPNLKIQPGIRASACKICRACRERLAHLLQQNLIEHVEDLVETLGIRHSVIRVYMCAIVKINKLSYVSLNFPCVFTHWLWKYSSLLLPLMNEAFWVAEYRLWTKSVFSLIISIAEDFEKLQHPCTNYVSSKVMCCYLVGGISESLIHFSHLNANQFISN